MLRLSKASLKYLTPDGAVGVAASDEAAYANIPLGVGVIKMLELPPEHTGLEAFPSKKKRSIHGIGVFGMVIPVWYWNGVAKPVKMAEKIIF